MTKIIISVKDAFALLISAFPCIVEQLLTMFVMTVSLMFAGKISGEAIAAVSMINTVIVCLQCALVGFTTAGTIIIGRLWGAGKRAEIPNVAFWVNTLSAIVSLILTAGCLIFKNPLLNLIFAGQSADFIRSANNYFIISVSGIVFIGMFNSIAGCCRGVGDNTLPMLMGFCFVLTDAALNFALSGTLKINGIACAMLISRSAAVFLGYALMLIKKSPVIFSGAPKKFSLNIIPKIFKIGTFSALEQFIFQIGFVIQQSLFMSFGVMFQAGYQIGANLNNICNAPAYAVGIVAMEKVSGALGRKDKPEAINVYKSVRTLSFSFFLLLSLAQVAFSSQLAAFYTSDANALIYGKYFTVLFGILDVALALFQGLSALLRGAGDVKYTTCISFIGLWVARILGCSLAFKITGNAIMSVTIGISADFIVRCVAYYIRIRSGRWLKKSAL